MRKKNLIWSTKLHLRPGENTKLSLQNGVGVEVCYHPDVFSSHKKNGSISPNLPQENFQQYTWQQKVPDTEVLQRAKLPSIGAIVMKSQLWWAGHLVRIPDDRMPKKLFYSELKCDKRSLAGQYKRYKDSLKIYLNRCNIATDSWEQVAHDRNLWRRSVHVGTDVYETSRIQGAEANRAQT
ncbi:hypothetical protein BSL78_17366 [Apostichopus japonicus]|uniref:Uncharacterized protein n=1 Tax=Stichopus japonicus TaxID=307972 RepID=A0A2G8KCP8_STIJA|nr:hypothetical protein BSL78_17366 [Apostichopus japonicus]